LVLLPGVQFLTGQYFDIPKITEHAHKHGALIGWDLAHAVGNLPLELHKWQVDFACWCTYKYLNSGPGAIGGAFMHENHHHKMNTELPRLHGWWGQKVEDRFSMGSSWKMKTGAQSYQLSNPPVLPCLCLEASAQIFNQAGIHNLRQKSLLLTGYMEMLLKSLLSSEDYYVMSPSDPFERGCQLSVVFNVEGGVGPVNELLLQQGIICDVRKPNTLRLSPTPLYNQFIEVYRAIHALKQSLEKVKNNKSTQHLSRL